MCTYTIKNDLTFDTHAFEKKTSTQPQMNTHYHRHHHHNPDSHTQHHHNNPTPGATIKKPTKNHHSSPRPHQSNSNALDMNDDGGRVTQIGQHPRHILCTETELLKSPL